MVAAFFHSFLAVSFTRHLTMFLIKILSSFSVCLILICSVALVAVFVIVIVIVLRMHASAE